MHAFCHLDTQIRIPRSILRIFSGYVKLGSCLKMGCVIKSHKREKNLFGKKINFAFMQKIDFLVKEAI